MSAEPIDPKHTPASSRSVTSSIFAVLIACCLLVVVGCCTSQGPSRDDLAQRIQSLGAGTVDVDLGRILVNDTQNTEYIIRRGKTSVPFLVEALSGTNWMAIGYAAHCLEKIGAAEGKIPAETTLSKLSQQSSLGIEQRFAVDMLSDYLKSVAPPASR